MSDRKCVVCGEVIHPMRGGHELAHQDLRQGLQHRAHAPGAQCQLRQVAAGKQSPLAGLSAELQPA